MEKRNIASALALTRRSKYFLPVRKMRLNLAPVRFVESADGLEQLAFLVHCPWHDAQHSGSRSLQRKLPKGTSVGDADKVKGICTFAAEEDAVYDRNAAIELLLEGYRCIRVDPVVHEDRLYSLVILGGRGSVQSQTTCGSIRVLDLIVRVVPKASQR